MSLPGGPHLCPIISLPSAPGMIRGQVLRTIQSLWMQTPPCRGSQLSPPRVAAREGLQGRRAEGWLWGQGASGAGSVPYLCGGGRGVNSGTVSRGGSPRCWPGRCAGLPRIHYSTRDSPPRLSEPQYSHLQMGSHIAMRVRPDLMTSSGKGTPNLLAHPGNHDCREERGSPDQITVTSVWGVSQFRTL